MGVSESFGWSGHLDYAVGCLNTTMVLEAFEPQQQTSTGSTASTIGWGDIRQQHNNNNNTAVRASDRGCRQSVHAYNAPQDTPLHSECVTELALDDRFDGLWLAISVCGATHVTLDSVGTVVAIYSPSSLGSSILWALHVTFTSATGETAWIRLGVVGNLVGVLWGSGWLDFAGTVPYWGNGMLLTVWLLTILSCKARWPDSWYLNWIDRVHWNRKGRILVDAGGDRCVEAPVLHFPVGFAVSTTRTNADTTSESEDSAEEDTTDNGSDSDDDDEPNRAYPSIEDNEIYGRIPSLTFMETGAGEDEMSRLLVAQSSSAGPTASNRVRSRRAGSSVPPEDAEDRSR